MVWTVKVPIKKIDELKKQVFGWASVIEDASGATLVDHEGDVIDIDDLEQAAYKYVLESRIGGEEHKNFSGVATIIESFVITNQKREALNITLPLGWWVGFQIFSDQIFDRVLAGDIKMFSIGGSAHRESDDA